MNLYENLINYSNMDYYPFHMPGHKRNTFLEEKSPYSYDITEIDGFDNLHDAEGILLEGMKKAAKLFQTKNTYYLVNGSTCGLLSAISAVTNPNDTILVARNSHKAVYNAVMLRGLTPIYLYPDMIPEYNIAGVIQPESVEAAFRENDSIKAVVITSPTYDGIVSDIESIAKIVHQHNSILIVDEAHGAHFPFCESFPKSALYLGADLVIQSVHKTLPSLTQTALLHRASDRVDENKLHKYLSIYQSSSPSYVLMASIERCIEFLQSSEEVFKSYMVRVKTFYEEVAKLKNIVILKDLNIPQIYKKDDTKIIILAKQEEISGVWLYDRLLKDFNIQPEMVTKDYVTCLSSVCDTQEGFDRLRDALLKLDHMIDEKVRKTSIEHKVNHASKDFLHNEMVIRPSEVDKYTYKKKSLSECVNEVAAEYIYLYPPGIPIVVPGERITEKLLERLSEYQNAGLALKGMQDASAKVLNIIKLL